MSKKEPTRAEDEVLLDILHKRYRLHWSYTQIAKTVGLTKGAVAGQIGRMKPHMREPKALDSPD